MLNNKRLQNTVISNELCFSSAAASAAAAAVYQCQVSHHGQWYFLCLLRVLFIHHIRDTHNANNDRQTVGRAARREKKHKNKNKYVNLILSECFILAVACPPRKRHNEQINREIHSQEINRPWRNFWLCIYCRFIHAIWVVAFLLCLFADAFTQVKDWATMVGQMSQRGDTGSFMDPFCVVTTPRFLGQTHAIWILKWRKKNESRWQFSGAMMTKSGMSASHYKCINLSSVKMGGSRAQSHHTAHERKEWSKWIVAKNEVSRFLCPLFGLNSKQTKNRREEERDRVRAREKGREKRT